MVTLNEQFCSDIYRHDSSHVTLAFYPSLCALVTIQRQEYKQCFTNKDMMGAQGLQTKNDGCTRFINII